MQWANESRRTYARAWGPIAIASEDNVEAVVWTLAHCSGEQVAYRKLSDGTPMRQRHRIGNALADTLAKQSAKDDKLPASVLEAIATSSHKLREIALWIGRCTVAASHFCTQGGEFGTKASHLRDSEGLASSRLKPCIERGCKRHFDEVAAAPVRRPGDLSLCPRWQQLRQRILEKARA